MIEVVYQGDAQEEQEGIALPKNVRQVGEIQRDRRIYIEDYVVTYIRQKIEENKNLGCVLILTGRKEYVQDTLYLFADGAFLVEYEQVGKDYVFSDRVWETVYEQVKEYFSGGEIVGWLLYDDDLTEERLLKAQKKNFPSEDMLLIKREAYEEDCTCYPVSYTHLLEGHHPRSVRHDKELPAARKAEPGRGKPAADRV